MSVIEEVEYGQVPLPFAELVEDTLPAEGRTIQERFERFHELNPWVYQALEVLTADYIEAGNTKVGIRMLWEVLRWRYNLRTTDPSSTFKVNDHYHSRFVRLLVSNHPEWADVFHVRELRAV